MPMPVVAMPVPKPKLNKRLHPATLRVYRPPMQPRPTGPPYCAETAAAKGGPGKKDCGGHLTVTVDTVEKCIADGKLIAQADCDLTMGQLAACSAVQAEDLCDAKAAFESKECVVVYKDCLFKGM